MTLRIANYEIKFTHMIATIAGDRFIYPNHTRRTFISNDPFPSHAPDINFAIRFDSPNWKMFGFTGTIDDPIDTWTYRIGTIDDVEYWLTAIQGDSTINGLSKGQFYNSIVRPNLLEKNGVPIG